MNGRFEIVGRLLVEWSDRHTCGTGPDGHYGIHEPGCGSEPVGEAAPILDVLRWADDRSLPQPPADDMHLAHDLGLLHLVPVTDWTPPPRRVGQPLTDRIRPERLTVTDEGRYLLGQVQA